MTVTQTRKPKVNKKSKASYLVDYARQFRREIGREFTIAELASAARKNGKWELSKLDEQRLCERDFSRALRAAKDASGVRSFVDAQLSIQQDGKPIKRRFYDDRRQASWALIQRYIMEQDARVAEFDASVDTFVQTVNSERKPGWPMFQRRLAFPLDQQAVHPKT